MAMNNKVRSFVAGGILLGAAALGFLSMMQLDLSSGAGHRSTGYAGSLPAQVPVTMTAPEDQASGGIVRESSRRLVGYRGASGALASVQGGTTKTELAENDGQSTETDLQRWRRLGLQVVPVRVVETGTSLPLEGVRVLVDGVHAGQDAKSGLSHMGWITDLHGPAPTGTTNLDGRTVVASPVELGEITIALGISLTVNKAGYTAKRVFNYPVDGTEKELDLERGNVLIVSAFREDTQEAVTGFEPELSWMSRVQPSDWSPQADGSLRTDMLPNGRHFLKISKELPNGEKLYSDTKEVTVENGETVVLRMGLKSGRTLRGRLSENVPRPVTGGLVQYAWIHPYPRQYHDWANPRIHRDSFPIAIEADGTFEFPGTAEGAGEIIALCDGFISEVRTDPNPLKRNPGSNPSFELSEASEPVVIPMVPTGNLEIRAKGPNGEALSGINIMACPNVFWASGMSQIFIDQKLWQRTTDQNGVAVIRNLRPGNTHLVAGSKEWALPLELDSGRWGRERRVATEAEKTTTIELNFEPAQQPEP